MVNTLGSKGDGEEEQLGIGRKVATCGDIDLD